MARILRVPNGIIIDHHVYELHEAPDDKSPCDLCSLRDKCDDLNKERGICTVLHNATGNQFYACIL